MRKPSSLRVKLEVLSHTSLEWVQKIRNHFLYRVASSLLCPAFYRYIRFTLIIRTISSEVGHCSCLDLQIINLGKRLTETVTLEIDWPKETEVVGKWLLYLMKINSTGVEHIECSPKGEINPRNMVSENITLRCVGHSACTYTFSKSSLGMWWKKWISFIDLY